MTWGAARPPRSVPAVVLLLLFGAIACERSDDEVFVCQEPAAVVEIEPVDGGTPLWVQGGSQSGARVVGNWWEGYRLEFAPDSERAVVYHVGSGVDRGPFELEMEVRIDGYEEIEAVSFGWLGSERFWHDRVRHLEQGETHRLELVPDSIAFGMVNGWRDPSSWRAEALRVVVQGEPGPGARVTVGEARIRPLPAPSSDRVALGDCRVERERLDRWYRSAVPAARERPGLFDLWSRNGLLETEEALARADTFRDHNQVRFKWLMPPLPAGAPGEAPLGIERFTTFRLRWHALDLVESLLIAYHQTDDAGYLDLAGEQARSWIDREISGPPSDDHFIWYDHGVAERQIALLMLWEAEVERGAELGSVLTLLDAIRRQGELLATPSFYVRNQPERPHNHGIFQDLALLATSFVFPEWPEADAWRALALERMLYQFDQLVLPEGASVENSASYQIALGEICHSVVGLLDDLETGLDPTALATQCMAMDCFWGEIAYPDGTWAAYGDTGRRPNAKRVLGQPAEVERLRQLYPEAGYAVWREPGSGDRPPWQLNIFAGDRTITHKHADDLSFTLWMDGTEWLIDPGFFAYGDSPHALYGRTAQAHNAVVLGGESYQPEVDQVDLGWEGAADRDTLVGRHRGYGQATVERRFSVRDSGDAIVLEDRLLPAAGETAPEAAIWFHAGDGLEAELVAGGVVLLTRSVDGRQIAVVPSGPVRCELATGREGEQLAGWFYPAFGATQATTSWRCETVGDSWTTVLLLAPDVESLRRGRVEDLSRLFVRREAP